MKDLIDKYFTDNYTHLNNVAKFHITRCGRYFEADILVSNAYIYLLENKERIEESDIPKWATAYMCYEMERSKSKSNYANEKQLNNDLSIDESFCYPKQVDIEENLNISIDIDGFLTTLDRFDLILWEVFAERGIRTKRDIAEHFNIDPSSALIYINKLKEKFKEYVES